MVFGRKRIVNKIIVCRHLISSYVTYLTHNNYNHIKNLVDFYKTRSNFNCSPYFIMYTNTIKHKINSGREGKLPMLVVYFQAF